MNSLTYTSNELRNSSSLGKPDASSLVESAYDDLRHRILTIELMPGAVLLESEIARMLGMSRTPVREAIVRLTHEGLVETVPRRGIRITPITARDVREINEVLACLEVQAVMSVARRIIQPHEIVSLEKAIVAMDEGLASGDMDIWAKADFAFHSLLFDLSPNQHLRHTARLYLDKAHRARLITLPMRRKPVYSNSNHAAVVEAIRRGDPETARDIHGSHKQRWSRELETIIEQFPEIFDVSKKSQHS